jgi:hypothetical protein
LQNIFTLLTFIFVGVALMVFLVERYAKPTDEESVSRLSSWLIPLVGVLLVIRVLEHYLSQG